MENTTYNRMSELKAFDDTKAGVKGLVDAGVTKIPQIFIHDDQHKHMLDNLPVCCDPNIKIPVIDLEGFNKDPSLRSEIINKVRNASEKWGFFQVINHGIPTSILDQVIDGIRRFFEQDVESKKEYYSRDHFNKKVYYLSNYNLYDTPAAYWSDTLTCTMGRNFSSPEELPEACRDVLITYDNEGMKLASTLLEVLSEALGLEPNYLNKMGCADEVKFANHYYPACPQPELTMGIRAHADPWSFTVLLQNQIGGLQVLCENQWFDVVPIHGALIVNLGYMIQLITNDAFKSTYHRVLSKKEGPRISVASFFSTAFATPYGPIKELLSDENPPVYSQVSSVDILRQHILDEGKRLSPLEKFKLPISSG